MNSLVFTHVAAPVEGVSILDLALDRLGHWLDVRPTPAIHPPWAMLQRGPPDRTFAANAKSVIGEFTQCGHRCRSLISALPMLSAHCGPSR